VSGFRPTGEEAYGNDSGLDGNRDYFGTLDSTWPEAE
jgi:hypothetical protein